MDTDIGVCSSKNDGYGSDGGGAYSDNCNLIGSQRLCADKNNYISHGDANFNYEYYGF